MNDRFQVQVPARQHSRKLLNCLAIVVITTAISSNSNLEAALVESYNGDYVVVVDATWSEYVQIFDLLYYDFSFELVWINIEAFEPTETWDGGPPTVSPYMTYSAVFKQVPDNSQMVHQLGLNKSEVKDGCRYR
jgi:hypothetical protein